MQKKKKTADMDDITCYVVSVLDLQLLPPLDLCFIYVSLPTWIHLLSNKGSNPFPNANISKHLKPLLGGM